MNFLFVKTCYCPSNSENHIILVKSKPRKLEKKKCSYIPNRNGDGDVQ